MPSNYLKQKFFKGMQYPLMLGIFITSLYPPQITATIEPNQNLSTEPSSLTTVNAQTIATETYQGMRIHYQVNASLEQKAELYRQINQLISNRLIPLQWLNFRHQVQIVVDKRQHPGGLYNNTTKTIVMNSETLTPDYGPVFFHEYMHAIHLSSGFISSDQQKGIRFFWFRQLIAIPQRFSKQSHMLDNDQEFFATSLTAYLVGNTPKQEPFSRERLQQLAPNWTKFIQSSILQP